MRSVQLGSACNLLGFRRLAAFLFLLSATNMQAQLPATPPPAVKAALDQRQAMAENSLLKHLRPENIGPSIMSGRVVDLAVNPANPVEFYVAYASGGLWHTANNGTSFAPVMDGAPTQNLGAIDVDWASGTIWVGTGENNASRSSYAGIGMYKSADLGQNWTWAGLPDSQHIGRISIHPQNPNEVVVGVAGHLYSPNSERGVYRTTDGGSTWERTLFIDEQTGVIDLVRAPENPEVLYAAAWQKDRKAWDFTENGPGTGIYKSTDGGRSWNRIAGPGSGFPAGAGAGRVGLAAFDANTVYAVLDNQDRRPEVPDENADPMALKKEVFKAMTKTDFLKLDNGRLATFLKDNSFPEDYSARGVKELVEKGEARPADLALYLEDANSMLFDTPVIGAEVYRSDDGGSSWRKTHEGYLDDLYYSYGYYFGQIRVAPYDKDQIYIAGVPLLRSEDGGATFRSIGADNVHADHHALWIDTALPGHLVNGNDGGINISYDYGAHWIKNNQPVVGQFYAIAVDNQDPYHVYGGLQDNGVWKGPHNAEESPEWFQSGQYPWQEILGGDGMQVQVDPRDANTVYTGFQFGNYFRLDLAAGQRTNIQPKHRLGEAPLRFNWQTPILLSKHNPDILYMGSNFLHRSLDRADHWEKISGDLTRGGRAGDVAFGTLTTISESPLQFGLLYVGTDDGRVHLSRDGGGSWKDVSQVFPDDLWVSRVAASHHKKERVYLALNGYRWDHFEPYIYVSEDYGQNWARISDGIPACPVNVVIEDPKNADLLFAGTDNGLYASLDRGQSWQLMTSGMPAVAVHDLAIQAEAGHLLIGTHGRSIFKADIAPLQALDAAKRAESLVVFDLPNIPHSEDWGNAPSAWEKPSTPGLDVVFYAKDAGPVDATIKTADGITLSEVSLAADPGINILSYDLAFSKAGKSAYLKQYKTLLKEASDGKTYLPKGSYRVELQAGGKTVSATFTVE